MIGRLRHLRALDEKATAIHVVISLGTGLEKWPHRNHQMKIVLVQLFNHCFRVWIVLVENVLTFALPPEPVLHYVVNRKMHVTILLRHPDNFFLRLVAVFALPKTVRPASK